MQEIRQIAVINAIELENYRLTVKEKVLEDENMKLKELLGKKRIRT
ncbi:MAG: hypothetical protein LKF87_11320 [Clostridium tyrobutyricum]|jgi:cell shape-determining protein MreC|nr:hypothetical protein [Clostridium tyrobutyricum]MCH4236450.1 hypothetical protein [Clostridium tyrobutyricum]MCH4259530.1 hypothetical protein [Clostridium tyrobutyricum]